MPPTPTSLNDTLRAEYELLFSQAAIRPERRFEVDAVVRRIRAPQALTEYRAVEAATGVPSHVVGIIHNLEASSHFGKHLHNGDPLSAKTVRVPRGHPKSGAPPFAWVDSAIDALRLKNLDEWSDWSVAGVAYVLERYNGWGYRLYHPHVKSPYLWSFSTIYSAGKYIEDGRWSETAISRQCGGMTTLLALANAGVVEMARPAKPAETSRTLVTPFSDPSDRALLSPSNPPAYPGGMLRDGARGHDVEVLQQRLLELGLRDIGGADGIFGERTDWAVRQFQARSVDIEGHPLEVDGVVGPNTWNALFGIEAKPLAPSAPLDAFTLELLRVAANEIGIREEPPGSNRGSRVDEYLRRVSPRLLGEPWCVAFVYWCFDEAARKLGRTCPAPRTAGVHSAWRAALTMSTARIVTAAQAVRDPSLVRPGMVFFIDTGGNRGHAGIVADVEGTLLVTIEGNTNDSGSREGIGVFSRSGRRISGVNLGFVAFA